MAVSSHRGTASEWGDFAAVVAYALASTIVAPTASWCGTERAALQANALVEVVRVTALDATPPVGGAMVTVIFTRGAAVQRPWAGRSSGYACSAVPSISKTVKASWAALMA